MSSSAADIKRTESEFPAVVRSIAKPFTPELLTATVRHALREAKNKRARAETSASTAKSSANHSSDEAPSTAPSHRASGIVMLGDTAKFPLLRVLRAIAAEELTGVLRLFNGEKPLEVWFQKGRVLIVTHRDVMVYLRGNATRFSAEQIAAMDVAMRGQSDCGCPVFLSLYERGLMDLEKAENACFWQGLQSFASLWTIPKLRFTFESETALPEYCGRIKSFQGSIDEWVLKSLRLVGDDALSALAWGDLTGIPAYTRSGYERIQEVPLLDGEMDFAAEVNGSASLLDIAQILRLPTETAQLILYRFLLLEIFDYWPESLIKGSME